VWNIHRARRRNKKKAGITEINKRQPPLPGQEDFGGVRGSGHWVLWRITEQGNKGATRAEKRDRIRF